MIRRTAAVVALTAVWLAAALGAAAITAYASGYTEPLDWLMGRTSSPTANMTADDRQAPPATTDRGSARGAADIDAVDRAAELAAADRAEAEAMAVAELEAELAAIERAEAAAVLADAQSLAAELAAADRAEAEAMAVAELEAQLARAEAEAMAAADQADAQLAAEDALEALNSVREADAFRPALVDVGLFHPITIREEDLEGLSHPEVQKQARAIVENVVASHEQEWPWLRSAYGAAPWLFYDLQGDLPCGSDSAAACVKYWTFREGGPKRDLLVATHLDAVRSERFADLVVHELAHAWEHTTTEGADMAAAFSLHYVGCYVPGRFDTGALPGELLADAVTMTVLQVGYLAQPTAQELLDREMQAWLYGTDDHDDAYGYYRLDFEGCLVDNEPTEELWSLLHIYLSGLDPIGDGTASIDETTEQQIDE